MKAPFRLAPAIVTNARALKGDAKSAADFEAEFAANSVTVSAAETAPGPTRDAASHRARRATSGAARSPCPARTAAAAYRHRAGSLFRSLMKQGAISLENT